MEVLKDLPSIQSLQVGRVSDQTLVLKMDTLAVEEPLEIRLEFGPAENRTRKSISITMRTPGNDFELAVGFLFTEGILRRRDQLLDVAFCGPSRNVVRLEIDPKTEFDLKVLDRHFYTSSSCGVCGKTSIEALRIQKQTQEHFDFSVKASVIHCLPQHLRQAQSIFDSTGGLHASGLFDSDGKLLLLREDVGRHNALDKMIGHYFLNDQLPLQKSILLVSGRASFELVQKASMAGIQIFAAVGAPSSLAVDLAKETDMTLLGFVRDQKFNIYHAAKRIKL